MPKWLTVEQLDLLTNTVFAFGCVIFIVSAASHIINKQNELQKEIQELRADVEELYLRLDNSK